MLSSPGKILRRKFSSLVYKQGQYNKNDPKIREYFYYVDHNGMLFLDDSRMKNFTSSFKDPAFLSFFFRNLKQNTYKDYSDSFPYVSLCGIERNYIRCDDLPLVFTHLKDSNLYYGYYTDKLKTKFTPEALEFDKGRLYHPTFLNPPRITKGLIRSQLVMDLSTKFIYDKDNTAVGIVWEDKKILFNSSTVK